MRASYWLDAAHRVWSMSKSLSFIAAINAIETLFPGREGHTCPECNRFHDSPGPTARFKEFVETYAATEDIESRAAAYNLRSAFVHGGALHAMDVSNGWAGLRPQTEEHRDLRGVAFSVARTAIRTWFLQHGSS